MADLIKLKRGKSTSWASKNLLLQEGEPGVELDTFRLKIGDGKTPWNDLPYIGANGSVDIPSNLIEYLGKVDTLPSTAKEGAICIYKDIPYIFDEDHWMAIAVSGGSEKTVFDSLDDANHYIQSVECIGKIITILQNNKYVPYIVNIDNELTPVQQGETEDFDVINGGNANTLS